MTTVEQSAAAAGLRARIAKLIAGSAWPRMPAPGDTTAGGEGLEGLEAKWAATFFKISQERKDIYRDAKRMDQTVEEVATALDLLSDNAVFAEGGTQKSFTIAYAVGSSVPENVREMVNQTIIRTRWYEKAFSIARETLLFGDYFYQYVVDRGLNVVRLMYMPPESMVRNEDAQGLLLNGDVPGQFAFEQVRPSTNELVAGFLPWQIEHLRWNRSGRSPYGRSLVYTARTAWKKLVAMEEALVINWITRAFARLLFILDVTNKSEPEAERAIAEFRRKLQTKHLAKDVEGIEQLSVVKDVFVGRSYREMAGRAYEGLTDVKVLDTSNTAFLNLAAIEYYRNKVLMTLRTPKAYLGLEEDINAKATLTEEDRRYARTLRRIQSVLSEAIAHTIELQLNLHGIDPAGVPFQVVWPEAVWTDRVDEASALENISEAAQRLSELGVVDREYVATKLLRMTDVEWQAVKDRLAEAEVEAEAGAGAEEGR